MKKLIRVLTTIILSSTSSVSIIACNNNPNVLPQKYDISFSEIKGINVETFDKKKPFVFFKIDKKNIIGKTSIPDDINSLYEKEKYVYFVVNNNSNLKQILDVYKLNENSTEKEIKDKLSNTVIKNTNINVSKNGSPYFNIIVNSFSGKI